MQTTHMPWRETQNDKNTGFYVDASGKTSWHAVATHLAKANRMFCRMMVSTSPVVVVGAVVVCPGPDKPSASLTRRSSPLLFGGRMSCGGGCAVAHKPFPTITEQTQML